MSAGKILRGWKRGDSLRHQKLNQPVDFINRNFRGANPIRQIIPGAEQALLLEVRQFRVLAVQTDYLTANEFNGTVIGAAQIKIALPYLLRRTPFGTRGGITYTYSSNTARTADDGTNTESQVIVPSYVAGDVIFAARNIAGGVGVTVNSKALEWIDMNLDGRAWAKEA